MAALSSSLFRNFRCTCTHIRTLLYASCPLCAVPVYCRYQHQFYARKTSQATIRDPRRYICRAFSTSTSASTSLSPTTLVDPTRPSIFYHLLAAPNPLSQTIPAYAVSFLKHPSTNPRGPGVLGWLPAAADSAGEQAGLRDFKENTDFTDVMHEVIKKVVEEGTDARLNAEAVQRGEGWMHINDERNVPAMGRINAPDDIIASLMVEDGRMIPQTYSPMPTYRICTTDGLTMLSEGLHAKLLEELERREKTQNG